MMIVMMIQSSSQSSSFDIIHDSYDDDDDFHNFIAVDLFVSFHNILFRPLTHEQLKMHGCTLHTWGMVATDALVLEHQAISIHNAN